MMTTLTIQNEANIQSNGKRRNGNCKYVMCIETGEFYNSVMDAAEKNNVHQAHMSHHLRGKSKTLHGKHFIFVSKATENLDSIATYIRKVNEDCAQMEFKAKVYDEWMAEQEAKRKKQEKADLLLTKKAEMEDKIKRDAELILEIDAEIKALQEELSA